MALDFKFNSTTLTGMTHWNMSEKLRIKKAVIPRRHGVLMDDHPVLDARTVSLKGIIIKDTSAALNTAVDTLKAALFSGRGQLYLQDDRYLKATLNSFKEDYIKGFQDRGIKWAASFVCEDPFWYGDAEETNTATSLTAGVETNVPCPAGEGNAPAHCVIVVNPTGSDMESIEVRNSHDDIQKYWYYENSDTILASNGLLTIDSEERTVLTGTENDLRNFEGDFFFIKCGELNTLKVTSDVAINSAGFTVTWTPRWY